MNLQDKFKVGNEYFVKYLEDGEIKGGKFKAVGREYRHGLVSKICFVNYGTTVNLNQVLSAAEIIFEAKESSDSDDESNSESDKVEDKAVEFESYKKHIEYFRSLNISDKWNLLIVSDDENYDERHEEVEEPENDDGKNNDQSIEIKFTRDEFRIFTIILNHFEHFKQPNMFLFKLESCALEGHLNFDKDGNKLLKLVRREHIKDSKDE